MVEDGWNKPGKWLWPFPQHQGTPLASPRHRKGFWESSSTGFVEMCHRNLVIYGEKT